MRPDDTTGGAAASWRLAQADSTLVGRLADAVGLSAITTRILVSRGIDTPERIQWFLEPSLERSWHDPSVIPGMAAAAQRVASAVRNSQTVVVFGDFDLDGVSAAATAARGLAILGANVHALVPNRFTEGYGLSEASIRRALELRPDVVVTVDCGISSAAEVDTLSQAGVDTVVTDHHEPGADVPASVPVANPKLDPDCPSFDLSGSGVALKLVEAVAAILGEPGVWRGLTDIAMLGTVADIVPLRGENRALVADGISRIRSAPRVSIAALCAEAGVASSALTADEIAYSLAPRLNAAGRIADPRSALELLLTDDAQIAEEHARTLEEHNRYRQGVEQDLSAAALALAERTFVEGDKALVLAGEGWHEGVKGIVASRLAAAFGVPTLLFAVSDGEARGSGRSAGTVDLYGAVSACSDLIVRFGGHEAAVGLTIEPDLLPRFRERLLEVLATAPAEAFKTGRVCDAEIALDDVDLELAAELQLLEPFGHGNPRPVFRSDAVFMTGRQRVGKTANHLRFTAYDGAASIPAIAFRCPDIESLAAHDAAVDLAYEISADEWRGRRRVQLVVRDVAVRPVPAGYTPAAELVEDLFAHADEIIAREEYAGIGDADAFHTKLAGVTFEGRQDAIARLERGVPLRMSREPENPHDENAVALFDPHGERVGYFNRRLAAVLAPVLDAGVEYDVEVADVTGGEPGRSSGLNVLVARRGEAPDDRSEEIRTQRRAELSCLGAVELDRELAHSFIGDRVLHEAQSRSLELLAGRHSCLTVMATGRGKSLIFQLHAARCALQDGTASVFVYPLRALVSDQAFHLEEVYGHLGLAVRTLTGESSPATRGEIFSGLESGDVDVVLTTPEFLEHHAARFAPGGRVNFVVIDEAHHVATSTTGHRPAYGRLGTALTTLGDPRVLAVTATADSETAAVICETLGIHETVVDPTVRDNLLLEDRRGESDKDGYLSGLAARPGKTIAYVNSREQSVRLARMLRKRVPEIAMRVAFYNGGLSRAARHAVERAFRDGDIVTVVATSAFGEGVNIPDVRNVVLYHLPFNDIEFNQMCGRAGRDGAPSRVHVLFGAGDGRVNEMVLASAAPGRDDLAALYLVLKGLSRESADGWFEITNADLAGQTRARRRGSDINDRGASSAIAVFRELGFVESEGHGAYRRLRLAEAGEEKVDLESSVRYSEGLQEIEEYRAFRDWALSASASELLARFNRPILPSTS